MAPTYKAMECIVAAFINKMNMTWMWTTTITWDAITQYQHFVGTEIQALPLCIMLMTLFTWIGSLSVTLPLEENTMKRCVFYCPATLACVIVEPAKSTKT